MKVETDLKSCIESIKEARRTKATMSIGYHGNVVDLWEALAEEDESACLSAGVAPVSPPVVTVSVFVCLLLCICLSACLWLRLCVSIVLSLCHSVSASVSVSVSVFACLCPSIPRSARGAGVRPDVPAQPVRGRVHARTAAVRRSPRRHQQ